MKPDDLRKRLAEQQPREEERPNGIDFYTDPDRGKVLLRFHHTTDNFMLTGDQLKVHLDSLLLAAKALGIKFTPEKITWE